MFPNFFFFGYLHSFLHLLRFSSDLNRSVEKKFSPHVRKFALKTAIHSHRFLVSYSSGFIKSCLFFFFGCCYKLYNNEDHVFATLNTPIQICLGRHSVG